MEARTGEGQREREGCYCGAADFPGKDRAFVSPPFLLLSRAPPSLSDPPAGCYWPTECSQLLCLCHLPVEFSAVLEACGMLWANPASQFCSHLLTDIHVLILCVPRACCRALYASREARNIVEIGDCVYERLTAPS